MFTNIKKHYSILILLLFSSLYSQNLQYNKCNELRNAFILGLDEMGLEIGLEVISKAEYKTERENGLILLGDHFFYKAISTDSTEIMDVDFARKAYALYNMIINDYPKSKNKEIVEFQIKTLENLFTDLGLFGEYSVEASTVEKLYKLGDMYELYSDEKPSTGFQLLLKTASKFQVANKYYDTIILNHPKFEVKGYYLKVMSYINNYNHWSTDKLWYKKIGLKDKSKPYEATTKIVNDYLAILDKKYPSSNYTMDAHFTFAGQIWNGIYALPKKDRTVRTKYHLEKILANDTDKLGLRYVLTKEFVIRNF